ncbi:hypothetical protein BR93DRAFT_931072 [Coniochaeta sp. PMI_546]|nr:hypothetical protein BR93DRAFT_931072 [Coniochaeta sp. PMI_546]
MLHALEGDLGGAGDEDEGDEDDDDDEMEYASGIDPAEEERLCEGLTKVDVEQGEVMEGVEMEVDGKENTAEGAEKKEEEAEAEAEHYLLGDDKF